MEDVGISDVSGLEGEVLAVESGLMVYDASRLVIALEKGAYSSDGG